MSQPENVAPTVVPAPQSLEMPAQDLVPITPGSGVPAGRPAVGYFRALLVAEAGTATIETAAGIVREDVPVVAGYNPVMVRRVIACDVDVWGVI